jgi:hypothetical protein
MRRKIDLASPAWWDYVFLAILLVAMSTQINLGDIGQDTYATQGYVTKTLKIALPDIALLLNIVWFALRTTLARGWKRLWWPPLPAWALIFAMALALVHSPSIWGKVAGVFENLEIENPTWKQQLSAVMKDKGASQAVKEGIAETIQFGLYFLIAPLLLSNLLLDRRDAGLVTDRREFALRTFALGAFAMIALALFQDMKVTREAPKALFGSPNAFAAWFAIALPLLFAWSQNDEGLAQRGGLTGVLRKLTLPAAVIGLVAVMSLWAHLALIVGLLAMVVFARGVRRVRLGVMAVLVTLFVGVLWSQSPRDARREPFVTIGSAKEKVKKQYIEWYAAAGWASPREKAFTSGVGPGNYQLSIGPYYSSLPNESKLPPDSNNLYMVQAVSLGVLGLSALLWTLGHFARRANEARKYLQSRNIDAWLPLGILGSLVSWGLVNIFHAAIVRGTGLVLAFLCALSVVALYRDGDTPAEEVEVASNVQGGASV